MAFLLRKMKSGWVRLSGGCNLSGRLYFDSFSFQGGANWLQHSYFGPGSFDEFQVKGTKTLLSLSRHLKQEEGSC